ncbi:MAG TPA: tyrosine-type recombinase/integrase [Planctomycetota bacterium]|nr:tyrosine-type recombinase/integrase [Planctomycetota bacterium]
MARRDPNKFEVKGNPSVWVRIYRHGREGESKDALWHYVFWRDGKRYRGSTGKLDHSEAQAEARREVEKVINTAPHTASPLTLSQAVALYLAAKWPNVEPSNRSHVDAKNRLEAFAEDRGNDTSISVLDMNGARDLVSAYLDKRKASVSAVTVHNDRRAISGLFTWLIEKRRVPFTDNPARRKLLSGLPIAKPAIRPTLPDSALQDFIEATRGSDVYPAVVLGLAIGMRPRAAARLKWQDVDFDNAVLQVKDKTGSRPRPLSKWAVAELQALHTKRNPKPEDGLLAMHPDTVFHEFKKVRDGKGLPATATLQALRRKFVQTLWQNGVEPQKVARIAGNSVGVIAKYYAELDAEHCRKEVELLDFSPTTASQTASPKAKKKRQKAS